MNPSSSRNVLLRQANGCDGDGCVSPIETWPLHDVYHRDARRRLCTSCLLLSHRSYYCCVCFLLVPRPPPWPRYEDGDRYAAPPAPTATCHACNDAVAHLACIYPAPAHAIFVCPACSAAEEGRPFAYGPPCRAPLDRRGVWVITIGARIAHMLMQQRAVAARAEEERLTRIANDARRRARQVLGVALSIGVTELPENDHVPPFDPPPAENHRLDLGESSGTAGVNAPPPAPQPRHAVPPPLAPQPRHATPPLGPQLAALTIGGTGAVTQLAMAATEAARGSLSPPRTAPLFSVPEAATAAAETSPPTRPTLQLFPVKASSSRGKRRALQLFQDEDDEEMYDIKDRA